MSAPFSEASPTNLTAFSRFSASSGPIDICTIPTLTMEFESAISLRRSRVFGMK
jgi:hypothetical protein